MAEIRSLRVGRHVCVSELAARASMEGQELALGRKGGRQDAGCPQPCFLLACRKISVENVTGRARTSVGPASHVAWLAGLQTPWDVLCTAFWELALSKLS